MRLANQPPVPPQPPAPDAAGHLPLPLLRQYVAGALPAAEQHRIEAHTLSCPRCAELLEGLELTDQATTDQALSQLRHRLHQRVAQEEAPRRAARAWQAIAAVVLLIIASTALWWNLRRPAPTPELARVATQPQAAPAAAGAAATGELATTAPAAETAAVAAVPRPARPRVLAQVRPRPAKPTRPSAPAPASADVAAVMSAEAPPAVAYNAPAAGAARSEASAAVQELKEAADSMPAPAAAVASAPASKAKRAVAEEGAARKAALPPEVIVTPQPVGGYIALREYLRRENKFEPEHPAIELSGTVRVKFTVTAAGKLENFQIVRGMRRDYDQEAIRLLCEGPAWQPGAANGRRTDQVVEINVSF